MLKEILSTSSCAKCRMCCIFDSTDLWELPLLSEENIKAVRRINPDTALTAENTFSAPKLHGDELFACPMLSDSGCMLSREEMPFDCRIWPFRIMKDSSGNTVIAVSKLCESVASYSDEMLRTFLEKGLGKEIFAFAEKYPSHIKPLMEGYSVILSK